MSAVASPPPGVVGVDLPLLTILVLAAVGSAVLLGLGLAAFLRRGSGSYLLIVLALAALAARTAVATLAMTNMMSPTGHHLLEHALDVVLVALVIAAVYYARRVAGAREGSDQ